MSSKIAVRRPTDAEFPELIGFLRVCFADGFEQNGYPWHTESVAEMVKMSMSGRGATFVAVSDGAIVGAMVCVVTPYLTDHRRFRASEVAWHAEPGLHLYRRARIMIKLLQAMEKWADCAGLSLVLGVSNDPDKRRVGTWLSKRGYDARETIYVGKVKDHGR